jgi:hypothetical protein
MPARACTGDSVEQTQVGQSSQWRRTHPATSIRESLTMVDRVAEIVSGKSVIGEARHALAAAGWKATITANRITIEDRVLAQFIPARIGTAGQSPAHWAIYSASGADPIRIVRA